MKLEINTVTKTLRVLSSVPIEDLMAYVKEHNMEDWSIEPEPVQYTYIPYVQPLDQYLPPYQVTCSTT